MVLSIQSPPGCPDGWPIKHTAQSRIQVVWGQPHSRQQPGSNRLRGIGIKMRHMTVPGYPGHTESWAGLYEQELHELYYPVHKYYQPEPDMVLHLPMMGMPPREPTDEMMREVRKGKRFSSFFKFATVVSYKDLNVSGAQNVEVNETNGSGNLQGDDVVLNLPDWPNAPAPADSLYSRTMDSHGFEFRTHLPEFDTGHDGRNIGPGNLWFIQLLPNELPSYHFWAGPNDQPGLSTRNRQRMDGVESHHYNDPDASMKQKMRMSPPSSPSNSASGPSAQGSRPKASKAGSKRPRRSNSSSDSGCGETPKRLKVPPTPKPRATKMGRATAVESLQ